MTKQMVTLLFLSVGIASASTYTVDVNTSALNGTTGSLDFQFNPGVGAFQTAVVGISNVAGGSYAGSQTVYGTGVTGGPIPSTIDITNVTGQDNEVLDSYKFSNNLTFKLDFSGPAITSPNGSDTAGSTFAFSVYSDAAGTIPANLSLAIDLGDQGTLTPTASAGVTATATPEPSTLLLMAAPLILLGSQARRRKA